MRTSPRPVIAVVCGPHFFQRKAIWCSFGAAPYLRRSARPDSLSSANVHRSMPPTQVRSQDGSSADRSDTRSRLLGATVSRGDLTVPENMSHLAEIASDRADLLTGGRSISLTVVK